MDVPMNSQFGGREPVYNRMALAVAYPGGFLIFVDTNGA